MVGLLEDPNPSNAASICCAMLCHLAFLYAIMCRVHEVCTYNWWQSESTGSLGGTWGFVIGVLG